jgi:FkbM family methyltransferase
MKAKELLYLLGVRPGVREYGTELREFLLAKDGVVQYAQWLHPSESPKPVEQEVVDNLRRYLRPGDVAIDIGAHTGDTALPMALAVGAEGCVLAFEPNRYVFRVLARNAALNPAKTRIVPHPYAVTPEDGKMTFEYSDPGFCNGGFHEGISRWKHAHAFTLEVEGVRLEPFLARHHADLVDRIRLVKVDAEGFDRSILESIRPLILRTRPYLKAEVFKRLSREQRVALVETIAGMGYRLNRVVSEADYLGEPVDASNVAAWDHLDVFGTPLERPAAAA